MRPEILSITSSYDLRNWYWLKSELVECARYHSISMVGGKFEILDRISYFLDIGEREKKSHKKITSNFDWAKSTLSLDTLITDNISFGPNFRSFMRSHIGKKFSCHSDFMEWVKNNSGKKISKAIIIWKELEERKKDPKFKRIIAPHNQMAQYIRDFFIDNPGYPHTRALECWKKKKQKSGTRHFYESSDLTL